MSRDKINKTQQIEELERRTQSSEKKVALIEYADSLRQDTAADKWTLVCLDASETTAQLPVFIKKHSKHLELFRIVLMPVDTIIKTTIIGRSDNKLLTKFQVAGIQGFKDRCSGRGYRIFRKCTRTRALTYLQCVALIPQG
eukprot:gene30524-39779_t